MRNVTLVSTTILLVALGACGGSGSAADSGTDAASDATMSDGATDTGTLDAATDSGTADAATDSGMSDAAADAMTDAGASDAATDAGASDAATDSGTTDAATDSAVSGAAFGGSCTVNADCATGLCWDFSDYDMFCGGKICSDTCTTDTDCQEKATAAGSSNPTGAHCRTDSTCDLVGAGLGAFFCS